MSENLNKKRIAKNSILLYVRMLFTMWLNLYATRLVLANLGVSDMGVYGVIGGIVGLFTVLSSGITNTVQRFITFELGCEHGETNKVFCSSLNIVFLLSALIFLLLESLGLWILYNKVDIPEESITQAFWVYQFSILACIANIVNIPYNALVNAHEKMDAYAVISILQVILTCTVAWCLSLYPKEERLLVYGLLTFIVYLIIFLVYILYCHIKFSETKYHLIIDKESISQIGKFAGITTLAGMIETIYEQGLILIINWTFGVALNAVYTIAIQLRNSVLSFALNIFKAISPQITKTYANGEIEAHKTLVYGGGRLETFMIFLILIPFLFRADYILKLWLGNIPKFMVPFSIVAVIISLIYSITEPIKTSVLATNRIFNYMFIPNCAYICLLPMIYWLSIRTKMEIVLIGSILIIAVIVFVMRLIYAIKVSPIDLYGLVTNIFVPCALVASADSLACWFLASITNESIGGLFILLILNSIVLTSFVYFLGLSKHERNIINSYCKSTIMKRLN